MQESRAITRRSASNLALAFFLLPKAKREGMSALYAFCRQVDDVADEEQIPVAERKARLATWRSDIARACASERPELPVNRELQPVIQRFGLPFELFDALLQGVEMDLETNRYRDYAELDLYCYRVASVVGLLSIEIFGYQNPACRDYAVALGKALQLTNILRDVGNDAQRGRIYLPLAELERFGVTEQQVLQSRYSPAFAGLAGSVAARAREFYRTAAQALPAEDRRSMATAQLMAAVYQRLLRKLEDRRFEVFASEPVRLNRMEKLGLAGRAWFGAVLGA